MLTEAAELEVGDDIFPVARADRRGRRPAARRTCAALLPEGPFFFPPESPTDQPLEVLLAELIREQILRRTFQEVPHAVEVVVEELDATRDDLTSSSAPASGPRPTRRRASSSARAAR